MSTKNNAARMYREAAVRGASPVGLVIILYEEALRALRRAETAMGRGDVEERTHALTHAMEVIGYLQSVLDFERGGRVAHQLSTFYNHSRGRMLEASVKNSAEILGQLIADFTESTEAWREVERAITAGLKAGAGAGAVAAHAAAREEEFLLRSA